MRFPQESPAPGPEGNPPGQDAHRSQSQGPGFAPGEVVQVTVTRCIAEGEEWPPERPTERFRATVVRVSTTGMVYLTGPQGAAAVAHSDQVQRISPPNTNNN